MTSPPHLRTFLAADFTTRPVRSEGVAREIADVIPKLVTDGTVAKTSGNQKFSKTYIGQTPKSEDTSFLQTEFVFLDWVYIEMIVYKTDIYYL